MIEKLLALAGACAAACGGVTASAGADADSGDTSGTGGTGVDGGSGDAEKPPASDASGGDAGDACSNVGSGPGLEACCSGQPCRGECGPKGECVCYGAGAPGGCPSGAACCKTIINGNIYGPACVAPSACLNE